MQTTNQKTDIHRHIGGLEICYKAFWWLFVIHRHIGGLEKNMFICNRWRGIHRHIGGLES